MLQVLVEQNSSQMVASKFQKVQTLYLRYMICCFDLVSLYLGSSLLIDLRLYSLISCPFIIFFPPLIPKFSYKNSLFSKLFFFYSMIITKKVERMERYQWKKLNGHILNKIGVSDKDLIPTPMSCQVDMGMLGEIEGSRYHSILVMLYFLFFKFGFYICHSSSLLFISIKKYVILWAAPLWWFSFYL